MARSNHSFSSSSRIRSMPRLGAAVLMLAATFLASAAAHAQDVEAQEAAPPTSAREAEKRERERELEVLRSDLERAKQIEDKLKTEIESLKRDRKAFSQALIDTAARIRTIEQNLAASEARIPPLDARETKLQRSLESRRDVLAEVLSAVTRLSRQPAPALMLRPEDAVDSIRSAMLLSAVVPELRTEAQTLVADLGELAQIRREIEAERDALESLRGELDVERRRLSALVEERQRREDEREKALAAERARSLALAKQVNSVTELLARIEKDIESAARAAEAARRKAEARAPFAALSDPARITPAIPFAEALGQLPMPAAGTIVREYGTTDSLGNREQGISVSTRPGTQVTAPCDGWVVYAGLFRSYGRLLIIDAGGGYHVLLAGMEQITVDLGQFVLTGEPVAVMGSGPRMASAPAVSPSQPILYIEFRKDGNSIDPQPWWAESQSEKARG